MIDSFLHKNVKIDKQVAIRVANVINSKVHEDVQNKIDSIFLYKQNLFFPQTIYESIRESVKLRME